MCGLLEPETLFGCALLERRHLELLELVSEDRHFVRHVYVSPFGEVQELIDLRLDLNDVALKI